MVLISPKNKQLLSPPDPPSNEQVGNGLGPRNSTQQPVGVFWVQGVGVRSRREESRLVESE